MDYLGGNDFENNREENCSLQISGTNVDINDSFFGSTNMHGDWLLFHG